MKAQSPDTGERDSLDRTYATSPLHTAETPSTLSEKSIYKLVRDQQVEIERLREQAAEAVRLRAELDKLRATALSS